MNTRDSGQPSDAVAEAMAAVARADFLPKTQRGFAEENAPLRIGYGQTNSQPSTVMRMLRLLDLAPGQKVLDLGAGSGWTTALLGQLVGATGEVIGVERIPDLVENARMALQQWNESARSGGHRESGRTEIRLAREGQLGAPEDAPFDRILVSAEAEELPAELIAQLGSGAVMVIPVAGELLKVSRGDEGVHISEHGPHRFVPLR